MLTFFQAGGWSMFVILALGVATLVAAALFARRPELSKVDAVKALSRAVVFSAITGVASNLGTVGYAVGGDRFPIPEGGAYKVVLMGFGESMSPIVMGFSFLTIVWLIMAVGHRRLRRVTPA